METLNDLMSQVYLKESYSKEEVLNLICKAHVAGINFQNKQAKVPSKSSQG